MPSHVEHCSTCRVEFVASLGSMNTDWPTMRRNTKHHGTGCAFSRCAEHCECSRAQQKAWRAVRDIFRVPCANCGVQTTHACQNLSSNRLRTRRHAMCGICCEWCRMRGFNSCPGAMDRPENRSGFHSCTHCHMPILGVMRVGDRCILCTEHAFVCDSCNGIFRRSNAIIGEGIECNVLIPFTNVCRHGYCQRCCGCSITPQGTFRSRPQLHGCGVKRDHMNKLVTSSMNPVPRFIGVEMEVAGFHRPKKQALQDLYNTCVKWRTQIGTDGSISGRNGVEIRTAPAGGVTFLRQLHAVTRAIKNANGFVNESCGLHVHVGLNASEMRSMIMMSHTCALWEAVEETVYKLVAESRHENRYCRKIVGSHEHNYNRKRYNNENLLPLFQSINGRYCGFNTHAVNQHGTFEFRLHHGSVNYKEIAPWALLCANIVNIGMTTEHISDLVAWVNAMGAARFLYAAAPTISVQEYLRNKLPKEDLDLREIRKLLGSLRTRRAA